MDSETIWFGFEQEYTIMKNNKPIGFPEDGYAEPQGDYYCGVGAGVVSGRKIAEEHLDVSSFFPYHCIRPVRGQLLVYRFSYRGKG